MSHVPPPRRATASTTREDLKRVGQVPQRSDGDARSRDCRARKVRGIRRLALLSVPVTLLSTRGPAKALRWVLRRGKCPRAQARGSSLTLPRGLGPPATGLSASRSASAVSSINSRAGLSRHVLDVALVVAAGSRRLE